ncbi:MAG TPA: hypothetical protein P5268_08990 [Candidatus Marinimicrobia bacterium]|nr:hypothetical protein [Candidatus Neomarinimicrobiota bacterium]HRS52559.1 hypothetical protein [Candidatus Neomarinimicrobiota bacterium]HRU93150.1 hypothetical protein [Candidatus Neomarinimicrobiota bacterium]
MIDIKERTELTSALVRKFGEENRDRLETGVEQVCDFWRAEDGDITTLKQFCLDNFIADQAELSKAFEHIEKTFETMGGVLVELNRDLRWYMDVSTGPILPIDYLLANFNLGSHVEDDLYATKIAFFVLLNYKVYTLEEILTEGADWDRQKWAEVRLAQKFTSRVPAKYNQKRYEAYTAAENYISNYNIYMHNLLTDDGQRLFPEELKLIAHWGLRDELKAQYQLADGFPRQKLIYEVMLKIINQEIPQIVINNPAVDWNVAKNTVSGASSDNSPESDTRYARWLGVFQGERACDPYYLISKSQIERRFNEEREIPEDIVRQLFVDVLTTPELKQTARLISKRLGRELEPFDIWYNQFQAKSQYTEAELDKITRVKFPTAESFKMQLPEILMKLGFDRNTANFLQTKIDVDPARGSGHAMGAARRSDNAHLRTRVAENGMDYKGYNIALHELGHCVEQVFSLNRIDHTLLQGVPNTAFTEAFAFVFQKRNLEVLGLSEKNPQSEHFAALNDLWQTAEIAAVALVDMDAWHWLYEHPEATPTEFKQAVIDIAKKIWNEYYYPVIGKKDSEILAIYSHMIDSGLYLPDYPLGHLISFQIEQYIKGKNLAREMERMCVQGRISPIYWMKGAVGAELSAEPMISAAYEALKMVK